MQKNSILTQKTATNTGFRSWADGSNISVVQSAWSGAIRAICLVFGLTLGWILIFDPGVVHELSAVRAAPHTSPHL
jgi:hypothetical protein